MNITDCADFISELKGESDMEIDIERLRTDLLDEYGTAVFSGFPMAIMDLVDVEQATEEELIKLAKEKRMNLGKYLK